MESPDLHTHMNSNAVVDLKIKSLNGGILFTQQHQGDARGGSDIK